MDAANVLRLMEQVHAVNGFTAKPDELRSMHWLLEVIARGFVAVADLSGRIVGAIALHTTSLPPHPALHLESIFFYVRPEFLEHGTADSLLTAAETFADEHQLALVIKTPDPDLAHALSTQRGYRVGASLLERPAASGAKSK